MQFYLFVVQYSYASSVLNHCFSLGLNWFSIFHDYIHNCGLLCFYKCRAGGDDAFTTMGDNHGSGTKAIEAING